MTDLTARLNEIAHERLRAQVAAADRSVEAERLLVAAEIALPWLGKLAQAALLRSAIAAYRETREE